MHTDDTDGKENRSRKLARSGKGAGNVTARRSLALPFWEGRLRQNLHAVKAQAVGGGAVEQLGSVVGGGLDRADIGPGAQHTVGSTHDLIALPADTPPAYGGAVPGQGDALHLERGGGVG